MKPIKNKETSFLVLCIGQSISILGSTITSFALSLWVYEHTKNPTHLALLTFAVLCPRIYFSIFTGHLIDQFDRKKILLICEMGFILTSFWLFFLVTTTALSISLLIMLNFIIGIFSCFKSLTFQTTVSMFVDKKNLLKYNGLISVMTNTPILLGPLLGGVFLSIITMKEIILIDIATFFLNFLVTFLIAFPKVNKTKLKKFEWKQIIFGTQYIFKNLKLKKILLLFCLQNFLIGLSIGLITAFLLEKTNGDNILTSYISSLLALGAIVGGLVVVKIAPYIKKPFSMILISCFLSGLIGRVAISLTNFIFVIAGFLIIRRLMTPIINALCETIWQKETPKEYQGRVFSSRRFFAQGSIPIAILIGVSLLNFCFPVKGYIVSSLSNSFKISAHSMQLSLFFILCGILEIIVAGSFYLNNLMDEQNKK